MGASDTSSKRAAFFEKTEPAMLVLAIVAVTLYLADLIGFWKAQGLESVYSVLAMTIDIVFFFDFVLKACLLRGPYFKSAWSFVDFISALPVLSYLPLSESNLHVMRFLRGLRFFMILRTLRGLRFLRLMRGLQADIFTDGRSPESRRYNLALLGAAVSMTLFFAMAVALIYQEADASAEAMALAREKEFYLVSGVLFAMTTVLALIRFQLPDVTRNQMASLLNVTLPHQLADSLLRDPNSYDRTVEMPATIVFADIQGFTQTVEALNGDLVTLKSYLSQAMDAVVQVHRKHDLIIDKYIGDCIMAFRGGDLVEGCERDHAYRVVRASLEALAALEDMGNPYFNKMRFGGASADAALIGAFGTSTRLSYTVLGDRVNLAARLEASVKQCKVSNLFCHRTYELTQDREDILWRRFGQLSVSGKSETMSVYEALEPNGEMPEWLETYHQGLAHFEAKAFGAARELFERAHVLRPGGDEASQAFVERCESLMAAEVPTDWRPIFETSK